MKAWTQLVTGCIIALFSTQFAYGASSEMDILLKKLQEKGILSASEAEGIAKETRKAAAKKAEKQETAAKAFELPEWVKNTKFKGDLRLRYEGRDREDDGRGAQSRGRFRLRAGAETKVTDEVQAGFGLATGSGDPRSANQNLTGTFERKDIWIDYAYARYSPSKYFSIIGGKFVNPLWQPSDMLISADVNPEGAAVRLEGRASSSFGLFLNSAFFILNDSNGASPSSSDPLMYVFQPGFKWDITKNTYFRFAPAYYAFSNLKGANVLKWTANSNTLKNGKYAFEYNVINIGGELGFKKPFGTSMVPYLGVFGGYLHNPDPSRNNNGYLAGVSVGHQDVKKACDWAFEYTFRRIDKDAWLDVLPDGSFYSGATGVMGHRAKLLIGLAKNTALGINYYNTWKVNGAPSTENLVQGDLIFKF